MPLMQAIKSTLYLKRKKFLLASLILLIPAFLCAVYTRCFYAGSDLESAAVNGGWVSAYELLNTILNLIWSGCEVLSGFALSKGRISLAFLSGGFAAAYLLNALFSSNTNADEYDFVNALPSGRKANTAANLLLGIAAPFLLATAWHFITAAIENPAGIQWTENSVRMLLESMSTMLLLTGAALFSLAIASNEVGLPIVSAVSLIAAYTLYVKRPTSLPYAGFAVIIVAIVLWCFKNKDIAGRFFTDCFGASAFVAFCTGCVCALAFGNVFIGIAACVLLFEPLSLCFTKSLSKSLIFAWMPIASYAALTLLF